MPHTKAVSLAARTVVALFLMIGFYLLAVTVIGLLALLLYFQFSGGYFNLYLTLFALLAIGVIIWSILPRWDRFSPPGPILTPDQQPRLFSVLKSIAEATAQKMPEEVYLLGEPNAYVSQRGGIMGLGGRRVMGLGLPLLKTLTVSELRAVLVHEFGHFYGGDTKLGPLIYRTRGMVIRTVSGLSGNSIITYLVRLPFYGYAKLYLRITQAVSRAQEYSADKLAARVAGSRATIQALRIIHGVSQAWVVYWRDEFVPALVSGFVPPLADGFGQFLKAAPVARQVSSIIDQESRESQTNPYDSHPSLKDRIAALQALALELRKTDDSPAISLIDKLAELEMALLRPLAVNNHLPDLKSVSWDNLAVLVYIPNWRKMVIDQKSFLAGLTPDSMPHLAKNLENEGFKLAQAGNLTSEQRSSLMVRTVGAALTLALLEKGWQISTNPGEPVYMVKDSLRLDSFEVFPRLRSGTLTAAIWLQQCWEMGITGLDLAAAAE